MSGISKEFKKWAMDLSGCNGGDIDKAYVWVCGIEWGGMNSDRESLTKDIEKGVSLDKDYQWKDHQEYTYGKSLAKLYAAIFDDNCKDEKDLWEYEKYIENLKNNEVFRLNLYPVAFKDTSYKYWSDNKLKEITGFDSKYLYQLWCFFNRFPKFLELRKEHKPKLVICTGVDYLKDFLVCFAGSGNIEDIKVGKLKGKEGSNNTHERTYYHVKVGETLIVVVPFFSGSYGLNSYYLLNKMGEKIKELLKK